MESISFISSGTLMHSTGIFVMLEDGEDGEEKREVAKEEEEEERGGTLAS